MNHLIQRQILEIQMADKQTAFSEQEAIRQIYWDRIVPDLDKAFSKVVPKDVLLRIGRLEIDLGEIPKDRIREVFKTKILEKLNDAFSKATWEKQSRNTLSPTIENLSAPSLHLVSGQFSNFQLLIFFLKKGISPWWTRSSDAFLPDELMLKVLKNESPKLMHFLKTVESSYLSQRLVKQFSEKILINILEISEPNQVVLWKELKSLLKKKRPKFLSNSTAWENLIEKKFKNLLVTLIQKEFSNESLKKYFKNFLIKEISVEMSKPVAEIQTFYKQLIDSTKDDLSPILKSFFENNTTEASKVSSPSSESSSSSRSTELSSSLNTKARKKDTPQTSEFEHPLSMKKGQVGGDFSRIDHQITGVNSSLTKELEKGIFINNAGLVLVAPFLKIFFETLNLTKNHQFISIEKREKALQLTQYLVFNEMIIPENEILLNKLMTGWEIEASVSQKLKLTNTEKKEVDNLLSSIINHWSALKKSSITALQETFLQREGKLIDLEDQYKLIVERKTVDILMDKIPWSFSVLQLPWMEKRILVEW